MKKLGAVLIAGLFAASAAQAQRVLSYADLVHRLTDLEGLALLPDPGEQCAQWSSYDRRSRYDAQSGKYIDWDANGDGSGIIRREGEESVLAEMTGPGCIWRIWSATPKNGHVRIFLDGASAPAVDLPFSGYFDGKNPPFNRSAIVHTTPANGWNNYTPIPYQKSCKILADSGWGDYYHFTYSTFPQGTQVPTFTRELNAEDQAALDQANRLLIACEPDSKGPGVRTHSGVSPPQQTTLSPGQATITRLENGPAAITQFRLKAQLPAPPADIDALRSLTVQIRWDEESEPSVWAPLGDFFGTAAGANTYRSLPLGLGKDGWWYCNWFMPFAKSAQLTLQNDGQSPISLQYEVVSKPLSSDISKYARFHAKWHRDAFLPAEPERKIDWPFLKTTGAGRYVGLMLHIWNPRGGWWGEGDEKFFVDGEKFPSTFGTGSEDYFGYAWSSPVLFQHAYHNQTHNDGGSKGQVSVNRWQIADNVPFHTSFEGCIEKYFPNRRPALYAAVAYWYLAVDGQDPYRPAPLNERIGYWTPVPASKVPGVLEGEKLKIISRTGGKTQEQDMTPFGSQWSNDAHLWWTDAKPGDRLDLGLPVAKTGSYDLILQLTKAPDYAIVQLYLDGQKLGGPADLYADSVLPTGPLPMGAVHLTEGDHKLTVEIIGANENAIKGYMVGLDYLRLEPVKDK